MRTIFYRGITCTIYKSITKILKSVNTICNILNEIWDTSYFNQDLKIFVKDRLGHDFRYAVDSKLIQEEIKWKPRNDFLSGIKKTINWYLKNKNWWLEKP